MCDEWLSWEQVLEQFTISSSELRTHCLQEDLPVYDSQKNTVQPIEPFGRIAGSPPHIVWGRIPLAENETLYFDDIRENKRIHFKGFPETGDFIIFRKDCAPTIQDELLYRVLETAKFPKIITSEFWTSLARKASVGKRKFITAREFKYPSIFLTANAFAEYVAESFRELKTNFNDISPSIKFTREISCSEESDEIIVIPYTIKKEYFSANDQITVKILRNAIANTQYSSHDSDNCFDTQRIKFTIMSGERSPGIKDDYSVWEMFYDGLFYFENENEPLMQLSTTESADRLICAPSLSAIGKVYKQYEQQNNDDTEFYDNMYACASYITYIHNSYTDHPNKFILLDKIAYCLLNGIYSNSTEEFNNYLNSFFFKASDVKLIYQRHLDFNHYKESIINKLIHIAFHCGNIHNQRSYLALAIKLDKMQSHSDTYRLIFKKQKLEHSVKILKSDAAMKKAVTVWLQKAEMLIEADFPHLIPLPDWHKYKDSSSQKKYFTDVAIKENIKLIGDTVQDIQSMDK